MCCGAIWGSKWLQYLWQDALQEKAIVVQKLLPILLASMNWGPWWVSSQVSVHCDNQAVASVVNSGYSKDRDMMHLMQYVSCPGILEFELHEEHISGGGECGSRCHLTS